MISFTIALVALILGYILYGKFVERVFQPDDRPTPAVANADGVDYIVKFKTISYRRCFSRFRGIGLVPDEIS